MPSQICRGREKSEAAHPAFILFYPTHSLSCFIQRTQLNLLPHHVGGKHNQDTPILKLTMIYHELLMTTMIGLKTMMMMMMVVQVVIMMMTLQMMWFVKLL